ncbi:ABC transporter permease [Azorhizobium doebereinerae]|uniref:ABC transporter permease n=1 Tax=Azorhizobium doebereinerae TaxID=281091 RepID=UPI0003FB90E9|nr:ABC transporter permease [Azorhizobium doebereinerae]
MTGLLDLWRLFRRKRTAVLGLAIFLAIVAAALLAPVLYPDDPADMVAPPLLWPGEDMAYPLGTDTLGRDIAAGIMHGARSALMIGGISTLVALAIGITVGALSGYYGGWVNDVLMRVTEMFQTMPQFILAVVLVAIFGPALTSIITALALVSWPPVARLVRAEVMSLREREFVQSCYVIGMSERGIIFGQILPNCLTPIIVTASIMVASAILTEAGLSFLGLGDPNVLTWGAMIGAGRESLRSAWFLVAEPGLAIILVVLSLNLVGEGLNDALNPKLKLR